MAKLLNEDDVMMMSDRLENAEAVVGFLKAASCCLCDREEPLTSHELFGMTLVYQWLEQDLRSVQEFIRKAA